MPHFRILKMIKTDQNSSNRYFKYYVIQPLQRIDCILCYFYCLFVFQSMETFEISKEKSHLSLLTDDRSSVVQRDVKKYTFQIDISNTNQCVTFNFEKQVVIEINLNKYTKLKIVYLSSQFRSFPLRPSPLPQSCYMYLHAF